MERFLFQYNWFGKPTDRKKMPRLFDTHAPKERGFGASAFWICSGPSEKEFLVRIYIQRFTQMICAESKIKLGFAKTHFKQLWALYLVQNADGLWLGKLNPQ